jgi:tRNA(adenine34) deaminase
MTRPLPPDETSLGGTWRGFMDLALAEAQQAANCGEAPVGAVLLSPRGEVLASARNESIGLNDPTAHAEILCLRRAGERLANYRLTGSILVVTLEPCLMCLGALLHARVAGVVFGAADPKAGALVSNLDGAALPFANHRLWVIPGVLAEECGGLLKRFFLQRRKEQTGACAPGSQRL